MNATMDKHKMAVLLADRKRIDDMIKEDRAAKKAARDAQRANQPTKLERVIAYQQTYPKWVGVAIAKMVLAHVDEGFVLLARSFTWPLFRQEERLLSCGTSRAQRSRTTHHSTGSRRRCRIEL